MKKRQLLSVCIPSILLLLMSTSASALTWGSPVEIGWGAEVEMLPDAAADRTGGIHVVFQTYPDYQRLMYNYFDGMQWTGAQNIGNGTRYVYGQQVAVDAQGRPHVVWQAQGGLYYSYFDGASWSTPVNIPGNQSTFSLAIDSTGEIFVSLIDGNQHVVVTHGNGTSWSPLEAIAQTACYYSELTTDPSGRVFLSYCDVNFGAAFNMWDGNEWSSATHIEGYCGDDWTRPYLFHASSGAEDFLCVGNQTWHWHKPPTATDWAGSAIVPGVWQSAAGSLSGTILVISGATPPDAPAVHTQIWDGSDWLPADTVSNPPSGRNVWATAAISSADQAVAIWSEWRGPDWNYMLMARHATLISNSPPTATFDAAPYFIPEGSSSQISASASDPDSDPVSFAWDLNQDGIFEQTGEALNFSAVGLDGPEACPITLRVCDNKDACSVLTTVINILNSPPTVNAGENPSIFSGELFSLQALFIDSGTADTHVATIDWGLGDGPQPAFVTETSGAGTVAGSKQYYAPGSYPVHVCVTDDDADMSCDDLTLVVSPAPIIIDIKSGGGPNSINCRNDKGEITVAVITTNQFNATTIDQTTVTFAGGYESHIDKKSGLPRRHEEDVDKDGDLDLVFHVRFDSTQLSCSSVEGELLGQTFDGVFLRGVATVRMVGHADSDADGSGDNIDNCANVANPDQMDKDGDRLGDACDPTPNGDVDMDGIDDLADNCPNTINSDQRDTDRDSTGDACDPIPNGDPDGDGIDAEMDNCVNVSNADQLDSDGDRFGDSCDRTPHGDADSDGIDDLIDNCINSANPDQNDMDGDGLGDSCDRTPSGDIDNDGIDNLADNCIDVANPDQSNADDDSLGDTCDPTPNGDGDSDGVDSLVDNCTEVANPDQMDTDGDGQGDICDLTPNGDHDGDGIDNLSDNCGSMVNPDLIDADGDGLGDLCDPQLAAEDSQ